MIQNNVFDQEVCQQSLHMVCEINASKLVKEFICIYSKNPIFENKGYYLLQVN